MICGPHVREACEEDLPQVKQILDSYRNELGFVPLPALVTALTRGWLLVAVQNETVLGVVNWWSRRDQVVVLYNIAVSPDMRGHGIGLLLLESLLQWSRLHGATAITLKCPVDLPSNEFYSRVGFVLSRLESGKHRPLNCWTLTLASAIDS